MEYCKACGYVVWDGGKHSKDTCICEKVDTFFAAAKGVPRADKPVPNKCLACWFDPCRCAEGLAGK